MFDAGPRQTVNLDGMFDAKKKRTVPQRALNWSAVRDENHDFELNTRGVFGGRGLIGRLGRGCDLPQRCVRRRRDLGRSRCGGERWGQPQETTVDVRRPRWQIAPAVGDRR